MFNSDKEYDEFEFVSYDDFFKEINQAEEEKIIGGSSFNFGVSYKTILLKFIPSGCQSLGIRCVFENGKTVDLISNVLYDGWKFDFNLKSIRQIRVSRQVHSPYRKATLYYKYLKNGKSYISEFTKISF